MAIENIDTLGELEQFIRQVLRREPSRTVGAGYFTGTGSPNGVVTAKVGAQYMRLDGGAATTLYVKESGAGTNTGWVAK